MTFEEAAVKKFNDGLRKLSLDIIPSEEYKNNGMETAEKIIKLLNQKSKFGLSNIYHSGSMGKETSIVGSDFDCVLLVNNEIPYFEKVLTDFEEILQLSQGYNVHNVEKTNFSIQFTANGFDFDFLPAPNFAYAYNLSGDALIDFQQRHVLDKIKMDPNEYGYMYSAGLASATVRFMKNQDGFANEMVRISKFWYKSLITKQISGAKTLIELVAVHAANKEDIFDKKSHLRCFRTFLDLIYNFESLNILFEDEHKKFPQHPIPNYIKIQKPIVLEPTNPYNNFAKFWDKNEISRVKVYAEETIRRIQRGVGIATSSGGSLVIPMELLFEPQPKVAPLPTSLQSNFLVSTGRFSSYRPDMKVRKESVMKLPEVSMGLKTMQKYLTVLMQSYRSGNPQNVEAKAKEKLQEFIDVNFCGAARRSWGSSNNKHDDYDVTFTLPMENAANSFSLLFSWKYD